MSETEEEKQSSQQRGEENITLSMEIDEEQEWESIVRKPHVRRALRRLAAETLRQEGEGETEEAGFAIE